MNICHIFNIDSFLINMEQKVWIIDKKNPKEPLLRINLEDYKLIKRGVYKKEGNSQIKFGSDNLWVDNKLKEKIERQAKGRNVNLSFSMREYTNSDVVQGIDKEIDLKPFKHLKNSNDDIILISTKLLKNKYGDMLDELTESLHNQGLIIKNIFFLNETFLSQNKDENVAKIMNVIISNLLGRKIVNSELGDKVEKYDKVKYYDGNENIIYSIAYQLNDWLNFLSSEYSTADIASDALELYKITTNNMKMFKRVPFEIYISSLVMKFENYRKFKNT